MKNKPYTMEPDVKVSLQNPNLLAAVKIMIIDNILYCCLTPYDTSKTAAFFKITVRDAENPNIDVFNSVSINQYYSKEDTSTETIQYFPGKPPVKKFEQSSKTLITPVLRVFIEPYRIRSTETELNRGSDMLSLNLASIYQHTTKSGDGKLLPEHTDPARYLRIFVEEYAYKPAAALGVVECTSKILTKEEFVKETGIPQKDCNHDWQLGAASFPSP